MLPCAMSLRQLLTSSPPCLPSGLDISDAAYFPISAHPPCLSPQRASGDLPRRGDEGQNGDLQRGTRPLRPLPPPRLSFKPSAFALVSFKLESAQPAALPFRVAQPREPPASNQSLPTFYVATLTAAIASRLPGPGSMRACCIRFIFLLTSERAAAMSVHPLSPLHY